MELRQISAAAHKKQGGDRQVAACDLQLSRTSLWRRLAVLANLRELRETAKIAVKRDWVEASEFRETPGRVKNKMMELLLQGMESIAEK